MCFLDPPLRLPLGDLLDALRVLPEGDLLGDLLALDLRDVLAVVASLICCSISLISVINIFIATDQFLPSRPACWYKCSNVFFFCFKVVSKNIGS